ncbi:MAG: hypothetical protein JRI56_07175, partial [Deltaproteobacteria bacterium]|nr:hypothetical protein [Deltaproteobacteria bacterium]
APIVKPKPKTQKIKKKVVPPPTKSKQKKAVSLRPKKPKPKPVATKDTERLNKALKNLKERVKEKESEAVIKNRLSAIESSVEDRTKKSAIATAGTAGSGQLNEVLRLYCIEIWAKVRNQWVLPPDIHCGGPNCAGREGTQCRA